jgi:hypothetical protein
MRISHRYKFIYFANPKTGSTAVRALLDGLIEAGDPQIGHFSNSTPQNPFYSHMRPVEAREAFRQRGWPFEEYYRFTTVRNPWQRALSLYTHIREVDAGFTTPFEEWLRSTATGGAGGGGPDKQRWRKYGTYSLANFAGDDAGTLLVDDVFRLEDLAGLPVQLAGRGLPVDAGAAMPVSNARRPVAVHTPATIALIAERYAEEIARFGYTPPAVLREAV